MRFAYCTILLAALLGSVLSCGAAPSESNIATAAEVKKTLSQHITEGQQKELENTITSMGLTYLADEPPAIEFKVEKLGGGSQRLSDLHGKVIVLNFWATWCAPCKVEMPSLQGLYDQFKGKDLVVLAVDTLEGGELVNTFVKDYGYKFPVLLDTDGQVNSLYSVQALPTTYIIDRNGKVIAGKSGSHDWSSPEVKKGIEYLLSKT